MAKKRTNGEGTIRQRETGLWECTIMDGFQPNGKRKYKRFKSLDAANAFLRDLYMHIDGMANVTNYTYKPRNESSIERNNNSGLIHINTVNEYANFMFFSRDSDFNQPNPSVAFVPEHVVNSVFNYIAGQKYAQTKQVLQNATMVMQKTA